jgi:hypothetical protein
LDITKGDSMADPIKVKPVKAAGGVPSEDELDQYEALLGLGVPPPVDQVQRLIEALRAKAAPTAAPTIHEQDTQPIQPIRRQAPPRPRRRKPRTRYVGMPVEPRFDWHSIVMACIVAFAIWTLASKRAMPEIILIAVVLGPLLVWLVVSRRRAMRKIHAQEVADKRSRSSATEPEYDDEEDDDDAHQRYISERWQGDNDLNGRNYSGRVI